MAHKNKPSLKAVDPANQQEKILEDILEVVLQEARRRLLEASRDPQRPRYHFLPPPGWMNDPIPYFYDGNYHVFFQYHPGLPFWGNMHWDHAVSKDLIYWENLPIALFPEKGKPDSEGCWTGSIIKRGNLFLAFYTGVYPQNQCLALSKDLIRWKKYPQNPVISYLQKPAELNETFRDPHVWQTDNRWYMLLGAGKSYLEGSPLLFTSTDLLKWEYLHPLYQGPAAGDECPDFFPLGEKWVLLSSRKLTKWAVGNFKNLFFEPETFGIVDYGSFYAGKTLLDNKNRRILFGWIHEERPVEEQLRSGWSGVLSLPRRISLSPDGSLKIEPVPELTQLRRETLIKDYFELKGFTDSSGFREFEIPGGNQIEIEIIFSKVAAREWGLILPGGESIIYDNESKRFMNEDYRLSNNQRVNLRIFVDNSVIEVFLNGDFCKTVRHYPPLEAYSQPLRIFCRDGKIRVEKLNVWSMKSIYAHSINGAE
ncbi:glycoside hydrolase family 32 protein [Atrimonas thermophila]|uniref:glycoside hydrolase family 32 protein n=1 Tax=Atrimonas thermophila TaxID=3064161 RepID=UPI00399D351F